jgi:hypothetical protein
VNTFHIVRPAAKEITLVSFILFEVFFFLRGTVTNSKLHNALCGKTPTLNDVSFLNHDTAKPNTSQTV